MLEPISLRIKERRLLKRLNQEELGRLVGQSKQTIYKYEKGIITNLKRDTIAKLAAALDTTPAYLMGWTEQTNNSYNNNSYSNNNKSIINSTIEIPKSDLSPDETELVKMFRSLSIAGKARVITLIIQLLEEGISKET